MKTLNIKGLPPETHELLKKQAEKNHRSLNQEVVHILEDAVGKTNYRSPDPETLLARIRETRKKFKGTLTYEEIDAAKREGRP